MLLKVSGARPHFRPVPPSLLTSRALSSRSARRMTSPGGVGIGHSTYTPINLSPTKMIDHQKPGAFVAKPSVSSPPTKSTSRIMRNILQEEEEVTKLDPFLRTFSNLRNSGTGTSSYHIEVSPNETTTSYFPTKPETSRTSYQRWAHTRATTANTSTRSRNQAIPSKSPDNSETVSNTNNSSFLRPETSYSNRPTTAATQGLRVTASYEALSANNSRATSPWTKFQGTGKLNVSGDVVQNLQIVQESAGQFRTRTDSTYSRKYSESEYSHRSDWSQRAQLQVPALEDFIGQLLDMVAQRTKAIRKPPKPQRTLQIIQERPKSSIGPRKPIKRYLARPPVDTLESESSFQRGRALNKPQPRKELPILSEQEGAQYENDLICYLHAVTSHLVQMVQYLSKGGKGNLKEEVMTRWESVISMTNVTLACSEGFRMSGDHEKSKVFVPLFLIQKMTADLLLELRDMENATMLYEALVIFAKDHEQLSGAMTIFSQIGYVLGFQKKHDEAIECFRRQLQYAMFLEDKESELAAYDSIGMQYFYKEDLEKAHYYHDRMVRGKLEKEDYSELRRRNVELLGNQRLSHRQTRVKAFAKLAKASHPLVRKFIQTLVRGDLATTLEMGLESCQTEDGTKPLQQAAMAAAIKIRMGKHAEAVGVKALPSPREVSLGQTAGNDCPSYCLLPHYDGSQKLQKAIRPWKPTGDVKERLLFADPKLEYLNRQFSGNYLKPSKRRTKEFVPRLVLKKNRNFFDQRESLAPPHDALPLSKKIELRLNQAKQLLSCSASFVDSRVEFNTIQKKISESKSNLRAARLSNLSHLSAIRTVSPLSTRSATEALLKMLEDFQLRMLLYVQNELTVLYTGAILSEQRREKVVVEERRCESRTSQRPRKGEGKKTSVRTSQAALFRRMVTRAGVVELWGS